jgi:hypothetical protein
MEWISWEKCAGDAVDKGFFGCGRFTRLRVMGHNRRSVGLGQTDKFTSMG